jgi:aralkylamine N-acetyltransferase
MQTGLFLCRPGFVDSKAHGSTTSRCPGEADVMRAANYVYLRRPGLAAMRELEGLYRAAGWWTAADSRAGLRALVAGSHCFLTVRRDGKIVGMGRAISDGVSDAYIQDVYVRREWRGRDWGAGLVRRLARRLEEDGLTWIGLVAVPGSQAFYSRLGFRAAPGHHLMRLRRLRR